MKDLNGDKTNDDIETRATNARQAGRPAARQQASQLKVARP